MIPMLAIFIVILTAMPTDAQVEPCSSYEEGSSPSIVCYTKVQEFQSFGPRVEINDVIQDPGHCDSDGACTNNYPDRFTVTFRSSPLNEYKNVSIRISEVTRHMTLMRCYRNGDYVIGVKCAILVYVKPNVPTCTGPVFVNGGSSAQINCTSDRVYPSARCDFKLKEGDTSIEKYLQVTTSHTDSSKFPGDKEISCTMEIPVSERAEGDFRFQVEMTPDTPEIKGDATVSGQLLPPLKLRGVALSYPEENDHTFDYPEQGHLTVNIPVTGSPAPKYFSLSVRDDESSGAAPLLRGDYSTTYQENSDGERGVITLEVKGGINKAGDRHFTFRAANGVLARTQLVYRFSVRGQPSQDPLPGEGGDDDDGDDNTIIIVGLVVAGVVIVVIGVILVFVLVYRSRIIKDGGSNDYNGGCNNMAFSEYDIAGAPSSQVYPSITYTRPGRALPRPPPPSYSLEPTKNSRPTGSGEHEEPFDPPMNF